MEAIVEIVGIVALVVIFSLTVLAGFLPGFEITSKGIKFSGKKPPKE